MPKAARILDAHTCPASSPLPHVGGVITGPGVSSVVIGYQPAAVFGDSCACAAGPTNAIVGASATVRIGNWAAARVGDATMHGGTITGPGEPTVLIG